jgi:hypothetical protein
MKRILFFLLAGITCLIFACHKDDSPPAYSAPIIFQANAKMTHDKDTIKSAGDTVYLTGQGGVSDTSRKYAISVNLKAVDSVTGYTFTGAYIKSLTLTFDTVGLASTGLFRWTSVMPLTVPALAPKTKLKASATFMYGLTLSSQTGNQIGTDSKYVYAK